MRSRMRAIAGVVVLAALIPVGATAEEDEELAKKLSNPVADLISVPFQFNFDQNIGPTRNGNREYLNFQPVIPIKLNSDWNLISRTILPIINQDDIFAGAGSQFGLGDVTQSFFFSPRPVPLGGNAHFIWGVGPVFLLPTGTSPLLASDKWGAGPTAVGLVQYGHWTTGMLANYIQSFSGNSSRPDVRSTFLQPFISYTTKEAWTFTINAESTYNGVAHDWTVPLNFEISKLLRFGRQPVSIGGGVRYYAASPNDGPHAWGARMFVTLLFPDK